jgi:hypothetical protein
MPPWHGASAGRRDPELIPMLAATFRGNRPAVLLTVPLLVAVLQGPRLHLPMPAAEGPWMPLYGALHRLLSVDPWLHGVLVVLVLSLVAVQLGLLVDRVELLGVRTQVPALLLPLFALAMAPAPALDPALAGMPFVLVALRWLWPVGNTGSALGPVFQAGFWTGIAALFHLPYAFVLPAIWSFVSLVRPFQWREYVLPLLGVSTVFYLTWAVLQLLGATPWKPLHTLLTPAFPHVLAPQALRVLFLMVALGMVLGAVGPFAAAYGRGVMRERNLRAAFLAWAAVLGLMVLAQWGLQERVSPVLAAAPLAVFCAQGLAAPKQPWAGELAVTALLVLALWAQWG